MTQLLAPAVPRADLLVQARRLALFTVAYNVVECVVAVTAAWVAGSRALAGVGLDSAVESISATALLWRLRAERRDPQRAEEVEQRALRVIGISFLVLGAFVGVEAVRSLLTAQQPDASPVGIGLTALSLAVMPVLAWRKRHVAAALKSRAAAADSAQTMACTYLSVVVLAGLVLNATLGWWWADPLAALGVVGFLVSEGREALEAEHVDDCC